jgi:hypothetical protein
MAGGGEVQMVVERLALAERHGRLRNGEPRMTTEEKRTNRWGAASAYLLMLAGMTHESIPCLQFFGGATLFCLIGTGYWWWRWVRTDCDREYGK